MKRWTMTLLALCLVATGCTSLRPVDLPTGELQREIRVGSLVKPGDTVRVMTADGRRHDMAVTAVDGDTIHGNTVDGGFAAVPIDDVATVERREFSTVKTVGLAYFGAPVLYVLLIAPLMVLMALSAG